MTKYDPYSIFDILLRKNVFGKESDAIVQKIIQEIEEIVNTIGGSDNYKYEAKRALADIVANKLQSAFKRPIL